MKIVKKKKPAAKKQPAKKLIEGKYSHKFLTRLEPDTGDQLEKLLTVHRINTMNGAVKYLIHNFQKLTDDLNTTTAKLQLSEANNAHYKRHLESFTKSFKALSDIKPLTKIQRELWDDNDDL